MLRALEASTSRQPRRNKGFSAAIAKIAERLARMRNITLPGQLHMPFCDLYWQFRRAAH